MPAPSAPRPGPWAVVVDVGCSGLGTTHGRWARTHPAVLLGEVLETVRDRARIDPHSITVVAAGCTAAVGAQSDNVGRQAVLAAGWPMEVAALTLERHDASPLGAVDLAASVAHATGGLTVAAAVDVATLVPPGAATVRDYGRPMTGAGLPDGQIVEAEARRLGLTRADVTALARLSRRRDEAARRQPTSDARALLGIDEPPVLPDLDALDGLAAMFEPDGVVTAATMAPLADGAAAAMIAAPEVAAALGRDPVARLSSIVTAAADPQRPVDALCHAADAALTAWGGTVADLHRIDLDERFGALAAGVSYQLGLDPDRTNPDGGSLARGAAPAAEGLRLLAAAVCGLRSGGGGVALVVAGGHGGLASAAVVEVDRVTPRS